jgi:hypothetical protein
MDWLQGSGNGVWNTRDVEHQGRGTPGTGNTRDGAIGFSSEKLGVGGKGSFGKLAVEGGG